MRPKSTLTLREDESKMPNNDTYLGEGVYASFDEYKITLITLDLRGQDSTASNRIALEPLVFDALLKYAKTKAKWELRDGR